LWDAGTPSKTGIVTVKDIVITCKVKDGVDVAGKKITIMVK